MKMPGILPTRWILFDVLINHTPGRVKRLLQDVVNSDIGLQSAAGTLDLKQKKTVAPRVSQSRLPHKGHDYRVSVTVSRRKSSVRRMAPYFRVSCSESTAASTNGPPKSGQWA
jgi:hypothetical protein